MEIHDRMRKHELNTIPINQEVKLGDIVYQFSPQAVINLSSKLTLQWIGPFCVVDILYPSLSVIFPVGNWAVHKKRN